MTVMVVGFWADKNQKISGHVHDQKTNKQETRKGHDYFATKRGLKKVHDEFEKVGGL